MINRYYKNDNLNNDEIKNSFTQKFDFNSLDYNYYADIPEKFTALIKNIKIISTKFEFIEINKLNFSNYQYNILSNDSIVLKLAGEDVEFITPSGLVFKVCDEDIINLIINNTFTHIICYKDEFTKFENVYSLDLLTNIFLNKKSNSIDELLSFYGCSIEEEYCKYYALLYIYPYIRKFIKKYNLTSYIDLEHKVAKIAYASQKSYKLSKEKTLNRISYVNNRINEISTEINYSSSSSYNATEHLKSLVNNNTYKPTFNQRLCNYYNQDKLYELHELYCEHFSHIRITKKLPLQLIDSYNSLGNIDSSIFIKNFLSDEIFIKGSYRNLFNAIVFDILKDTRYINLYNENNIWSETLKSNNVNFDDKTLILLDLYFKAYISGCKNDDDYINYFLKEEVTILTEEELFEIKTIFLNNFKPLIDRIDTYNTELYKTTKCDLIHHSSNHTPLYIAALSKQRLIIKTMYSEIDAYCSDFNKKNKSKIKIDGISNNSIYLSCDHISQNVAIDTLNRLLVTIFNKFINKVTADCYVEVLSK